MLVPTRRSRRMMGVMNDPFKVFFDTPSSVKRPVPTRMKTDIQEVENGYEISIDLPGYKKEEVTVELKEGYLSVSASQETESEEKNEGGTYLRKERFSGSCSRKFFIGKEVSEEDVKAHFENGVLKIDVPKKEKQPELEEKKTIAIEG